MRQKRVIHRLLATTASLALAIGLTGFASPTGELTPSENDRSISSIEVHSEIHGTSSTLTIEFDEPVSPDVAEAIALELSEEPAIEATSSRGTPSAPVVIYCNSYHSWSDSNGRFTLQRACGSTSAPWGFKLSASTAATVVGNVHEAGMMWQKNGIQQSRQASHSVHAYYQFHGTFSGLAGASDRVNWYDTFTWRHNIAGGGTANLLVAGTFDSRRYA
ncbi:hypothetical protein EV140_0867 [Microcella alkaliphila]|uniref:Uncharacterized protein n=1 Tax=Microcella alkaliphila TaxID=279828 RepID=A0A4Q7TNE0_9MICO|nr:hypothetical protein [Microcella alkaliphila]RZT62345.1 hypothetical protein EV140_0867 [Microcella alkaliphila]